MWDTCNTEAHRQAEVQGRTLCTGAIIRPRLIQPHGFAQIGTIMEVKEQTQSQAQGWLAWLRPWSAASHRGNTTRVPQLPSPTARGYSGRWNKRGYPLTTQINTSAVVHEGFLAGERLCCPYTCCGFPKIWKEFFGCHQWICYLAELSHMNEILENWLSFTDWSVQQ